MLWRKSPHRGIELMLTVAFAAVLASAAAPAGGKQGKPDLLRIGATDTVGPEAHGKGTKKDKGALETLKSFIKEETGFASEIGHEKDWRELAAKMATGTLTIGVFQGYEFAWAQDKDAALKPLALAVNVHRYPVLHVLTNKGNPAKDFAGLKGQSIAVPAIDQPYLRLFVEQHAKASGQDAKDFFAKITAPDNVEDALDDAVDGIVQAAVVDNAALDAFKRRKPGRFAKLNEVAKSPPFLPVVVAYYEKVLDPPTLKRLKDGLLAAKSKAKAQTLLTLFRLTGFEDVPADYGQVLAQTRQTFPPPPGLGKNPNQ
jgi:ABC-type phosphate/phosphonate transport system substrate-binding protein